MSVSTQRETAKILPFPPRGRAAVAGAPSLQDDPRYRPAPGVIFGSWYHQDAINAAEQAVKQ